MDVQQSASFIRSLCMGDIAEDLVLPYPTVAEEEREMLHSIRDALGDLLGPREEEFRVWDEAGEFPEGFLDELKEFGLFSLVIPEEQGGMGLSATAYSRTLQEIARYDGSVAVTVGAHSSIGMRGLLLYGTEEQKARFYPKLATGEMVAAFCLTEPGAGSDAAAVATTARRQGDDWILRGSKIWVTNGGFAQFFTVFAKTGDETQRGKLTAFIVTSDMEGVSVGPHEDKMGIRASSTVTLYLDDVRVPDANRLGEVHKGFKVAMNILNSGRTGLGGGCVGGMKRTIERVTRRAKDRSQFGKPIAEFGLIQQKIGHMVVECYAAESVVNMVAGRMDQGDQDYAIEAAISKVFATECLWRTADEALQLAGGSGYMRENPYERVLRDARINRIFEGTNDILRLFIGLSGMADVGEQLKELTKSLRGVFVDPIKGFGLFSDYALRRASFVTGIGRRTFTKLHEALSEPADQFASATRELAATADRLLRKHGRKVIDKQFAIKRLADIMIDLYVLACVLSRVDSSIRTKGLDEARPELDIAKVFAGQVRRRVARNFSKIDANDDEQIKALAAHALEHEGFVWDNI